jgi:hypothetical protein
MKDINWSVGNGLSVASVDHAILAVLMDVRDELKRTNRVLQCPNCIAIPFKLDEIITNTAKQRRRAKKK